MPKARRPRAYERLLVRPRTWAGSRVELPATVACLSILLLIFLAEIRTPPSSVVGILAALPLLISTWMLSRRAAGLVLVSAIVLVVLEVAFRAISGVTGAVEVIALAIIAGLVRLYASRFDLLFSRQNLPSLDHLMTKLSTREREVVHLTVDGRTAPQIADLLHISERTVESHLANAYTKLGVNSKFDLVRRAAS
jgi:DNA-binding CsgD family transcriptional regulator